MGGFKETRKERMTKIERAEEEESEYHLGRGVKSVTRNTKEGKRNDMEDKSTLSSDFLPAGNFFSSLFTSCMNCGLRENKPETEIDG